MLNKISRLLIVVIMLICSISLSVTYSKYLLTKNVGGEITTRANCIDMGITSLKDCMLVMDTTANNVESAKLYISSKVANLAQMSPTIKYAETSSFQENKNGLLSTYGHFTLATSYTFNSATGIYTLNSDYVDDVLSDKYINYYTCGGGSGGSYPTCSTMYKILDYEAYIYDSSERYVITGAEVYTYKAVDSFDSEVGLYQAKDDMGTTYYYRGNVKNNYVSYGGFIWRIIRQNGDGSIRLIYSGKDTSSTGKDTFIDIVNFKTTSKGDPAYSGYMYNENFQLFTNDNYTTYFRNFSENAKLYFADGYEFDEETKLFKLTGNFLYGTWKDNYEEILSKYPYTCRLSNTTGSCFFVVHAKGYKSNTTIYANLITYSSKSYAAASENVMDSQLKKTLDTWYKNNILVNRDNKGNLYADYLSDEIFCNDRAFYSGNGYAGSAYTVYNSYQRMFTNKTPSFTCTNANDKFSINSSIGNGKLNYPVGTLTADEAMYAGAQVNIVNTNYYLNVGERYWTMTPHSYDSSWSVNRIWYVDSTGGIYGTYVMDFGVRPVINLRSDIKITSGNGTSDSPYVVSL